jgi:hypothetical protein
MARTITICQQHHGENKFLFVNNIMARTSYYLSTTLWREQVSICQQHHGENKFLFVSNIMAKRGYCLSATP